MLGHLIKTKGQEQPFSGAAILGVNTIITFAV